MERIINHHQSTAPGRVALVAVFSLFALILSVKPSGATVGTITKADLSGPWAATITGDTGCGITTLYFTFTLNTSGNGSGTVISHTSGCGDGSNTFTFTTNTLSANGRGTANIGCGPSCGWNINIQVAPDRSVFNLVDVSPANPGNYIEGTAIHQGAARFEPHQ
jgi:hypothetical protein